MSDNEYQKIDRQAAEGNADENLRLRATYSHGSKVELPNWYRFVVLETIFDPTIIDAKKIAYFEHVLQVSNIQFASVLPRNAIIARRVLDGRSAASEPAMFLFPMLPPNISLPCQPGEHVWVMFEHPGGKKTDLGYWLCRIVEPGFVEDVNHTHPPRANDTSFNPSTKDVYDGTSKPKYEFANGMRDEYQGERYTIAESATIPGDDKEYERLLTNTDGSKLMVYEPVPRYRKRPGEIVFEGTNNSLVIIGRDRTGAVASYVEHAERGKVVSSIPITDDQEPGAGSIDLVAGRGQTADTAGNEVENSLNRREIAKARHELVDHEGDTDFFNDRSRVYVAQRTKIDTKTGLNRINGELGRGPYQGKPSSGGPERSEIRDTDKGDGGILIKSDKVRLIARSDVEIVVTGYSGRDAQGRLLEEINTDEYAVVALKSNGDIVFRPSKKGYIKLGDDSADRAVMCSDVPAVPKDGIVTGPPVITTMGGQLCGAKVQGEKTGPALSTGQGTFATKVLVK